MLTSPKLMLPFQIARMQNYFAFRTSGGGLLIGAQLGAGG
jgi:hypothetical protein